MSLHGRNALHVVRLVLRATTASRPFAAAATITLDEATTPPRSSISFTSHPAPTSFLEDSSPEYNRIITTLPTRNYPPHEYPWTKDSLRPDSLVQHPTRTKPCDPLRRLVIQQDYLAAKNVYLELISLGVHPQHRKIYLDVALSCLHADPPDRDGFLRWASLYPNRPATKPSPEVNSTWLPIIRHLRTHHTTDISFLTDVLHLTARLGVLPSVFTPLITHLALVTQPSTSLRILQRAISIYSTATTSATSTSDRAMRQKEIVHVQIQGFWNRFLRRLLYAGWEKEALDLFDHGQDQSPAVIWDKRTRDVVLKILIVRLSESNSDHSGIGSLSEDEIQLMPLMDQVTEPASQSPRSQEEREALESVFAQMKSYMTEKEKRLARLDRDHDEVETAQTSIGEVRLDGSSTTRTDPPSDEQVSTLANIPATRTTGEAPQIIDHAQNLVSNQEMTTPLATNIDEDGTGRRHDDENEPDVVDPGEPLSRRIRGAVLFDSPPSALRSILNELHLVQITHPTLLSRFVHRYLYSPEELKIGRQRRRHRVRQRPSRKMTMIQAEMIGLRRQNEHESVVRLFKSRFLWLGLPNHPRIHGVPQDDVVDPLEPPYPNIHIITTVLPSILHVIPRTDRFAYFQEYLELAQTLPPRLRPTPPTHHVFIREIIRAHGANRAQLGLHMIAQAGYDPGEGACACLAFTWARQGKFDLLQAWSLRMDRQEEIVNGIKMSKPTEKTIERLKMILQDSPGARTAAREHPLGEEERAERDMLQVEMGRLERGKGDGMTGTREMDGLWSRAAEKTEVERRRATLQVRHSSTI